jgi:hypothetical protein
MLRSTDVARAHKRVIQVRTEAISIERDTPEGDYPRRYRQTAKQWMSPAHSSSDSSSFPRVVSPGLIPVPTRAQSAHLERPYGAFPLLDSRPSVVSVGSVVVHH